LKWRNGFENNNMWVIYSDTYSQGQATQGNALPTIWASSTFTDAGLVDLINTLPARAGQIPFTNVTAATSWLRSQGVYFLSNQNYPQIVTNGLSFLLDAGFSASFPNGTGTTWYDISGNDNNATLTNGPSWSNSATTSFITFDGTDDWAPLPTTTIGTWTGLTISCLVYMETGQSAGYPAYIGTHVIGNQGCNQFIGVHNNTTNHWCEVCTTVGNYEFIGSSIPFQQWYEVTMVYDGSYLREYINGVEKLNTAATGTLKENAFVSIGRYDSGTPVPKGKFQNFKIYNRHLSQSEILQNYYKGPIVTSGLTMALDAANVVSYSGTGTTWKNLTANAFNGTLTNGPIYDSDGSGSIVFDGANDNVSLSNSPLPDNFTYSIWVKRTGDGNQGSRGIVISNGSTYIDVGFSNGILFSLILSGGSQNLIQSANGTMVSTGVWAHYTATYNRQKAILYLNGVEVASSNYTLPPINDFSTFRIGEYAGGGYNLNGKIGNALYYNRALSANEVQQNYNAQRGRFGI
jgi:hypothetical protein